MISEMSLMRALVIKSESDKIFDALSKTGATQIKKCGEYELASPAEAKSDQSVADLTAKARAALKFIDFAHEQLADKTLPPVVKDGFGVGIDEFLAEKTVADKTLEEIGKVLALEKEYSDLKTKGAKIEETARGYKDYACLKEKFSFYQSTRRVAVYLGTVASDRTAAFTAAAESCGAVVEVLGGDGGKNVICTLCLKESCEEVESALTKAAFTRCGYSDEQTATEVLQKLDAGLKENENRKEEVLRLAATASPKTKDIKIYLDYLAFTEEKEVALSDCAETSETLLIEAYVPTEAADRVQTALKENSSAAYVEVKPVPRDEFAPTLMKNNRVVRNFEAVTNMYSAPAYGALDPNGVMAFFFSLFMGVIMGDAGYGLMMIIGGFLLASRQREGTSIYRMAKVFAYGGFFAIAFGALFDSYFGYPLVRSLSPEFSAFYLKYVDPVAAKATIAGITVPSALLWCLALGAFQIAVSLLMKAVQCFGRGQVAEGIFSGLVWSLALISFILTAFFAASGNPLLNTFIYPTIALFALGILTAGITQKGFKKVTGIFGAAYGLINYVSDILSYARLYGLMLAGAQIASIFTNSIAVGMLFPLGAVGVIAGVLVIILGNVFNLAMSLLGAYIHDSRLQYVEFFGRFYEGEGELFAPLGSQREFIYFK